MCDIVICMVVYTFALFCFEQMQSYKDAQIRTILPSKGMQSDAQIQ